MLPSIALDDGRKIGYIILTAQSSGFSNDGISHHHQKVLSMGIADAVAKCAPGLPTMDSNCVHMALEYHVHVPLEHPATTRGMLVVGGVHWAGGRRSNLVF